MPFSQKTSVVCDEPFGLINFFWQESYSYGEDCFARAQFLLIDDRLRNKNLVTDEMTDDLSAGDDADD